MTFHKISGYLIKDVLYLANNVDELGIYRVIYTPQRAVRVLHLLKPRRKPKTKKVQRNPTKWDEHLHFIKK